MRRADIDRWTSKRVRQIPAAKGFIIRRGNSDVEAFNAAEAAEVSSVCRPGDVILAIMQDDSVGLSYHVEEGGPDTSGAGVTGSVIRVVGEQIGKANEGIIAGYEGLLASHRAEIQRLNEVVRQLSEEKLKNQGVSIELARMQYEVEIEEKRLAHSQAMTEEYLGKAMVVLDQLVTGFMDHHTRKEQLRMIFHKLKPATLQAIMADLSEADIDLLMKIAESLEDKKSLGSKKGPKQVSEEHAQEGASDAAQAATGTAGEEDGARSSKLN